MPQYKLVYFNVRGRAEISRILFAQAGVDYEDCRVTSDEFKAMKGDPSKCPLGQLPVLFVDDHPPMPQSHAIERYLARKFDMYGKTAEETARIDVACECLGDIFTSIMKMFFEKDEAKKAELGKSFVEKDSVTNLTALSKQLEKGKGFLVGDKVTLADVAAFCMTEVVFKNMPKVADMYPALKKFSDRMRAEPKIKAWLAKRPVTDL